MKPGLKNKAGETQRWVARLMQGGIAMASLLFALCVSGQTTSIPLFQYAIFYNGLCEFTWTAPMTIYGKVHVNGDMYTGSAWQLTFNSLVDVTGTISSPAWNGFTVSDYTVTPKYNATYLTNTTPLMLVSDVPDPHYSQTALRGIIEMPPETGETDPAMASLRYYNKAGITLLVSNTSITAIYKSSMSDPAPTVVRANYYPTNNAAANFVSIVTNFPFLSVTNYWATNPVPVTDQRERAVLKLTEIDMRWFAFWLTTNAAVRAKFPSTNGIYPSATNAPNILYIADNRTYTTGQLTAIRLRNAQTIPTNLFTRLGTNIPSGFTVATPNPLYVYGNYNCPNSAYLGSTNTLAAGAYPASLISDALTILSGNWQDSKSGLPYSGRNAVTTSTSVTLNAAIVAGTVYSTGSDNTSFSGGVHNLPRLLENWSAAGVTLALNTSMVNLFPSARATNQFQTPGIYYNAPSARVFNFDANFMSSWKLPPGTPNVQAGVPKILTQPQNQKAPLGQTATFSTAVTGTDTLRYQWKYLGPQAPRDVLYGTNASLILSNIALTDAGSYSVRVTNVFGATTSQPATLTIAYPPIITNQPFSRSAPPGINLAFLVGATGTNLTYTWLRNGSAVSSSGSPYLTILVASNTIGSYRVVVSNPDGAVTSSIAQLYLTTPQYFDWANTAAVADGSSWSRLDSVSIDYSGRYAAGRFTGRTLDLGGIILTNNDWSAGNSANFICKYDAAYVAWARIVGTNSGMGCPLRITRGSFEGAMLLAGRFSGSADFGGISKTSVTPADQFVLQFGVQTSTAQWVKTFPIYTATGATNAFGFKYSLSQGEWFISGPAEGTVDFGSGVVLTNCSAYVAKFGLNNQIAWARETPAPDTLALGSTGNVYVAGSPGVLTHYDAQGNELWSRAFPIATDIAVDEKQNVHATGFGSGTFDGFSVTNSSANGDCFVAKCDASGQLQWLQQLGSTNQQAGTSIAVDRYGNTYITSASAGGLPESFLKIGPSTLSNAFTFIASYDPAGSPLWARAVTSTNRSALTSVDFFESAAIGNGWTVGTMVGGYFSGTAFLDAMPLVNTNPCTVYCPEQMFISRFDCPEPTGSITISAQPTNTAVVAGTDATFSVTASGGTLSYQWFYNQTNLITGATNSVLLVSNVQTSDIGNYSVVLNNAYGTTSSAVANLTFAAPPSISGPPADLFLPVGNVATFVVSATGTGPLNYQWQFNGSNLPGATRSSLVISNISPAQSGEYEVVITNLAGSASSTADLYVMVPPVLQPLPNLIVLAGQDAVFSANITGSAPLVYQWRFNNVNLPDATNATLLVPYVSPAQEGAYAVTVTNLAGSATSTGSLTLAVPPTFGQPLPNLTAAVGQSVTFSSPITGTGPLSYQWLFNGTNISDATNATLTFTNILADQGGDYSLIITNLAGAITNTATLTLADLPMIDGALPSLLVVAGQDATFTVFATGTGPLAYQWQFNGGNIPDATNASLLISNAGPAQTGQYRITVTNVVGSTSASGTLALAVAPAFEQPLTNLLVVAGHSAAFAPVVTGTEPLTYQWQLNGTNLLEGTNATLALTNISAELAGDYTIVVTNVAGSATNTATLTLAVPPTIDVTMQNKTLIAGQNVALTVSASGTGPLNYSWQFNGAPVSDATDTTLSLTNIALEQAGSYLVTVTNIAGAATNSATLSVYATAAATLSALPTLSSEQFQFSISGVPGFNYVVEVSTNFVDWAPVITNVSPFTLTDDQVTNFPARFYRSIYTP